MVVLERETLGFVWNRRYEDAYDFQQDLNTLKADKLVIFALQPNGGETADPGELNGVLGQIGAPDYVKVPRSEGGVSVIGVPGMNRGEANVNVMPTTRTGWP